MARKIRGGFHRGQRGINLRLATCLMGFLLLSAVRGETNSLPKPFNSAGVGVATYTSAACADIACNNGDSCVCLTGSGPARRIGPGLPVASISYELSVDESAAINAGDNGGQCLPSTGKGILTLRNKSTINFFISGLDCAVPGVAPGGLFGGTVMLEGGTAYGGKIIGSGSINVSVFASTSSAAGYINFPEVEQVTIYNLSTIYVKYTSDL